MELDQRLGGNLTLSRPGPRCAIRRGGGGGGGGSAAGGAAVACMRRVESGQIGLLLGLGLGLESQRRRGRTEASRQPATARTDGCEPLSALEQPRPPPCHAAPRRYLFGSGNYYLDVLNATGQGVAARLWFLDSGSLGCEALRDGW